MNNFHFYFLTLATWVLIGVIYTIVWLTNKKLSRNVGNTLWLINVVLAIGTIFFKDYSGIVFLLALGLLLYFCIQIINKNQSTDSKKEEVC